jgi:ATP-dependent RNA helicase HelY
MPRQRVNERRKRRGKEEGRGRERDRTEQDGKSQHARSNKDAPTPRQPLRAATPTRELRRLLAGIGTPAPAPFEPDPFQTEALAALEYEDVLVTAPTGSGKTWIAREEIRRLLAAGKRAWYTSPLKALTNSKYQEFKDEFGSERVGILTGDRKENADAPLVVGTTEIYRNQLFDALRGGTNIGADLVVLDEAHYLADEERGHVWEEAIILSPPRVRLLLLSATIGNAEEFAAWIAEVRGVHCGVVARPGARPVPLRAAFLYPDGQLIPLLNDAGKLHPEIVRLGERQQQQRQERTQRGDWRSRRGGWRRD